MAKDTRFNLNKDNTARLYDFEIFEPAVAATIDVAPDASEAFVHITGIDQDITLNLNKTNAKDLDKITVILEDVADATSRTITFGGDAVSTGTISVGNDGKSTATFVYDGTNYVETGRAVT